MPNFKIISLLTLSQFFNIVDFMLLMPLSPKLMREFGLSSAQFGVLISAYALSAAPSGLLGTLWLDKFDRKKTLFFTMLGFSLGTFFCGFAESYTTLLIARIFTGAFGGIIASQVLTIVADIIPLEKRASAVGIIMSAFSIASIVGVPLSLWVADQTSWQMAFYLLAGASFLCSIAQYSTFPNFTSHLSQTSKATQVFVNLKNSANQQLALIFMFLIVLSHFIVIPYIAPYWVSNANFPEKDLPYMYFVGGLCAVVTTPLFGKLADRFGRSRMMMILVPLSLIPVYLLTNLEVNSNWAVYVISALFMVFISGRMIPSMALITGTANPKTRGGFMSLNSSIQMIAIGGSTLIGSMILEEVDGKLLNYSWVGMVGITVSLVALFVGRKLKEAN
jgi:MFS transporter, DHA1 family, inner membrane transport protein